MHWTTISVLRFALRAQIAIWRLLRKIKGRFSARAPRLTINLSIEFGVPQHIAVLCRSGARWIHEVASGAVFAAPAGRAEVLYKAHSVNSMVGCLPRLLPMPIWIVLSSSPPLPKLSLAIGRRTLR